MMIYRLASIFEKMIVGHLRLKNHYPPLFVVGVPRSGTTAVVLHLFNRFRFACFPNISRRYSDAPVSAALWGWLRYQYNPTYYNAFGEVEGPMAPSDGWEIFLRWFPRYDLSQPPCREKLFELKTIVRFMELLFGAPFINKNNSNPVRIPELAQLFPDALFVHVERDFFDTVQSNLEARDKHGVPLNKWWSVAPPRYYNHCFSDELEQVAAQVWDVNEFITESLAQIDSERWLRISYREFCLQPDCLLQWVSGKYRDLGLLLSGRSGLEHRKEEIRYSVRDLPSSLKRQIEDALDKIKRNRRIELDGKERT